MHAVAQVREQGLDVERALDARLEIFLFLECSRVLQIVECAAIRDGRNERAQLQRSHLDSFAEARHPGNSAAFRRLGRHGAGLLLGNLIPGEFAETQSPRIIRNGVKSHAAPEFLEVGVIGMRHRFGQVQRLAPRNANHGVARHEPFLQRRHGNHRLDGRARFETS